MKDLKININSIGNRKFIVSYRHPFTQARVRHSFSSRYKAKECKEGLKMKFQCVDMLFPLYERLTIEELFLLFVKEMPNDFFSSKEEYLIDFIETFGDFLLFEVTLQDLKKWSDQIQKENRLKDVSMREIQRQIDAFFSFLNEKEVLSESPLLKAYYREQALFIKPRDLSLPNGTKVSMNRRIGKR